MPEKVVFIPLAVLIAICSVGYLVFYAYTNDPERAYCRDSTAFIVEAPNGAIAVPAPKHTYNSLSSSYKISRVFGLSRRHTKCPYLRDSERVDYVFLNNNMLKKPYKYGLGLIEGVSFLTLYVRENELSGAELLKSKKSFRPLPGPSEKLKSDLKVTKMWRLRDRQPYQTQFAGLHEPSGLVYEFIVYVCDEKCQGSPWATFTFDETSTLRVEMNKFIDSITVPRVENNVSSIAGS